MQADGSQLISVPLIIDPITNYATIDAAKVEVLCDYEYYLGDLRAIKGGNNTDDMLFADENNEGVSILKIDKTTG